GADVFALAEEFAVPPGVVEEFLETVEFLLGRLQRLRDTMELPPLDLQSPPQPTVPREKPLPRAPARVEEIEADLFIDGASTGRVQFRGREVRLTQIQFHLLPLLARRAGESIPYERIESYVRPDPQVEHQQVSYHQRNLEDKLSEAGAEGPNIETHAPW